MKIRPRPSLTILLPLALLAPLIALPGDEETSSAKPEAPYTEGFDALPAGDLPDAMLVIDGDFQVVPAEDGDGRVVELGGAPIQESAFIFARSTKGAAAVQADFRSERKRRAYPRFGVGLHGLSGFRFRVVPAGKRVELIRNEDEDAKVATAAFDWASGEWLSLRLEVSEMDGGWVVRAWAWPRGEERPGEPILEHRTETAPGQGKPSVWATPYAGKPIRIDNLRAD